MNQFRHLCCQSFMGEAFTWILSLLLHQPLHLRQRQKGEQLQVPAITTHNILQPPITVRYIYGVLNSTSTSQIRVFSAIIFTTNTTDLHPPFHAGVRLPEKELVQFKGRRLVSVEPHRVACRLPQFVPDGAGHQRDGQAVHLLTADSADGKQDLLN